MSTCCSSCCVVEALTTQSWRPSTGSVTACLDRVQTTNEIAHVRRADRRRDLSADGGTRAVPAAAAVHPAGHLRRAPPDVPNQSLVASAGATCACWGRGR